MAGQKRSFKIRREDFEEYLAIADATDDKESASALRLVAPLFGIEYNADKVKATADTFRKVAEAMRKGKK